MTALGAAPRAGRRRRWTWIVAASLTALLLLVIVLYAAAFHVRTPWSTGDGDSRHVYRSDQGNQAYQVHLPPQHTEGEPLPVLMAIHGCAMTGYGWNSMQGTTQLDALADREGFIVVYPTQRTFQNAINCWDAADPRQQHRGSGEPALLAGVAREVVETFGADPHQVHVAGASSGAGAAVVLGATYPDVFASVTSVAGGEYGLNQVDPDDPEATPPEYTARQAWAQMGERARPVSMLVVQGVQDPVVPTAVAHRLVRQWTAVQDLVDDGLLNDSLDLAEQSTSVPAQDRRHGYTHTTLTAPDGESLVETYLVQDMGHAWPGPEGDGLFTDRAGPDASALFWAFARAHPMTSSSTGPDRR